MRTPPFDEQPDAERGGAGCLDGPPAPALLRRVVEALAFGILEIDDDWRIAYANPAAALLLLEDAALSAEAGRIRLRPERTFLQAQQWLALAAAGGPAAMAVARADGAAPFLLEYLFGPPDHECHALAILDPGRPPKVRADRLSIVFGLTAAEAQLAAAIAAGGTIGSFAAGRQVTEATARTHLEGVFAKTGVRRQSQLVGHVAACALPLRSRAARASEAAESRAARRRHGGDGRPPAECASESVGNEGGRAAAVASRGCTGEPGRIARTPEIDGVGGTGVDGAAES